MDGIKDAAVEIRRISPDDGFHYYYGYYDNPAFSGDDTKHLCHRVRFWDRLPLKDDRCELGFFDLKTGGWEKLAETGAFNFQQGSMLQWNPQNPDKEIIYNIREGDEYRAAVQNIETGKRRILPRPVANVSPDGKWGLSINLNRVYDFRPGYGYSGVRDPWYDIPQPRDDGIWVIDMETGAEKFILDYERMAALFSVGAGKKLVVNHITFSPGGGRLLFLLRTFPGPREDWLTGLGTIGRGGEDFHLMNPLSMASHYHWRDPGHLLIWATVKGLTGMHLITDEKDEAVLLDPAFFTRDIHCIYSPDRRYITGDSYPDGDGCRPVYLFDTESGRGRLILRARSDPKAAGDIRSDLHNRWSRDGRFVSFDSTHEGFRGLYIADLAAILG
jgi:hypothetical protein